MFLGNVLVVRDTHSGGRRTTIRLAYAKGLKRGEFLRKVIGHGKTARSHGLGGYPCEGRGAIGRRQGKRQGGLLWDLWEQGWVVAIPRGTGGAVGRVVLGHCVGGVKGKGVGWLGLQGEGVEGREAGPHGERVCLDAGYAGRSKVCIYIWVLRATSDTVAFQSNWAIKRRQGIKVSVGVVFLRTK